MIPEPDVPVPQRKRFRPPLTASCPHRAEALPEEKLPSTIPGLASSLPTSRPRTYPAEKLMAEKRTTTPALMTQVIIVGLGSVVVRRVFFAEWVELRSLDVLERRLTLLAAGG